MNCPDCEKVLTKHSNSCRCGWVSAPIPVDGLCHAPDCSDKERQRIGKYRYCIKHYDQIRERMGLLSETQKIFQKQLEITLEQQRRQA